MSDKKINAKVLMVGPDRSLKGGIVAVVDGYFEAGLDNRCARFAYQGTGVGANLIGKSLAFAKSLVPYRRELSDFDIVHFHISAKGSFKRKSLMASMAKRAGKKVILHEHSGEFARDFEAGDDTYRERVRITFNSADRVIVLSEEWRNYFADHIMLDTRKLSVLHNGVSIPNDICSPCAHQDILFLGRLDARKSPDVLLRASKEVLNCFPEARLVFGGDGDIDMYRNLAAVLGIADRCDFLGWVSGDAKGELFSRAGIYCLPSKNEGLPMSVIEAMAHGLPVVSTAVGGIPRLIESGREGFLIDVDDEEALSEALCRLLGSAELRKEMGIAAHKKASREFSIETSIEGLLKIYSDLCQKEGQ